MTCMLFLMLFAYSCTVRTDYLYITKPYSTKQIKDYLIKNDYAHIYTIYDKFEKFLATEANTYKSKGLTDLRRYFSRAINEKVIHEYELAKIMVDLDLVCQDALWDLAYDKQYNEDKIFNDLAYYFYYYGLYLVIL